MQPEAGEILRLQRELHACGAGAPQGDLPAGRVRLVAPRRQAADVKRQLARLPETWPRRRARRQRQRPRRLRKGIGIDPNCSPLWEEEPAAMRRPPYLPVRPEPRSRRANKALTSRTHAHEDTGST